MPPAGLATGSKGTVNMLSNRQWEHVKDITVKNYKCGYSSCGKEVASEKGWYHTNANGARDAMIYICPNCKGPTFFDAAEQLQLPGVSLGHFVESLPSDIEPIWSEIRKCTSHAAYTAAVLLGRKLLMHIAVGQGASAGKNFVEYVDYLVQNHYSPPNSKTWVDKIRTHGNEATHEIITKGLAEAEDILTFLEMLLKFIYEFPNRGAPKTP
jgi:hypothetical protein